MCINYFPYHFPVSQKFVSDFTHLHTGMRCVKSPDFVNRKFFPIKSLSRKN